MTLFIPFFKLNDYIIDIRKKFGKKYDKGIREAIKYAKTLPEFKK